jgi:signal transduction histidine kinase
VELCSPHSPREATGGKQADPSRLTLALVAAAGVALCVVSVAVVLSTPGPGDRPLIALGYALVIAVPVAVGLWTWYARSENRFGRLLVAAGFLWFLPTLASSGNELVYSIGRIGGWLVEPVVMAVILAFPSGRLTTRLERALVAAAAGVVGLLYLPTALVVERYPVPVPYAACGLDCPDNTFLLLDTQPAFVDAWLIPVRELISVLIFVSVLVVLGRRVSGASRLMRRTLTPVLAAASARAVLFIAYFSVRRAAPTSPLLDAIGWIWLLCLPAIAFAFLVGLLRSELFAGAALRRLALRLRNEPHPAGLTTVLRNTLGDPSLELVRRAPGPAGGWVDVEGKPVRLPAKGSGRVLTEVQGGDSRVAGVIHDGALLDQRDFVESAASLALAALDNEGLTAQVDASLTELARSRARIQAAADSERRRIERDLHDGAQQRLVALRIRLGLADDLMREDPARARKLLGELGGEAEEALEEVRSLARGVYPSLLSDEGLKEALRSLAHRAAVPTTVDAPGIGRYPPEIEGAVYFSCLEALQNAAKHARGATSVSVSVRDGVDLRFEVRDDGAGFATGEVESGAGFTNMQDRLAAVGGELTIHSEPGRGTRVTGTIPVPRH